jgi:putative MATE family efflux protein
MRMKRNNLTEGPILKSLIALTIPVVLANILQTAYHLVDTFWVGRLGAGAVAAVSMSLPIIFLTISLGGGISIAGSILVAQYKGKKIQGNVDFIAAQTMFMVFFASLIITAAGYLLAEPVIGLMGAEPSVTSGAVSYLKISMLGTLFVFGFFAFQSLVRGVGEVKKPMYIVLGTVLLNLVLDPLLIMGYGPIPAFGVAGAAIATVITQGVALLIGVLMLFGGRYGIHIKKRNLRPDFPIMKKIFMLGLPSSIEQSMLSLSIIAMVFLVTSFGTMVTASYGIGIRIFSFIIIPILGLSMATSTLAGQNIGAGKIKRVERIVVLSSLIGFGALTTIGVVVFLSAEALTAFFVPGNAEVIANGASFIRILSLTFGFVAIHQVVVGVFRGAGEMIVSMVLTLILFWILRFPLAYILSNYTALSFSGIWWAFPIANIIGTAVAVIWYLRGTWKTKNITKEFGLSEQVEKEAVIEEGM